MIADFAAYPDKPASWLLGQLAVVAAELYNAHIVLATTRAQEKSARVQAFLTSTETSVAGRERDADAHVFHLTNGIAEIQGRIYALTEERDLIKVLLEYAEK